MATQEDVPVLRRHPWHTPLHARSAHRPPIQTLPIAALNNEATSRRLASGQLSSPPGGRQGLVGVKLFCPFDCCTQHSKADKPSGFCSKTSLKNHLADTHADDLYKLSDNTLKESGLFVCRECGDYVAATEKVFLRHIKTKHIKTRTTTNHNIVTRLLYNVVESVHNNHWEEGLA